MLWVLVAHAEYVCFSLSPVLCCRLCRKPNFPPVKMHTLHAHKHTHICNVANTELLTLWVMSEISCCESGQCSKFLLATVFLGINPASPPTTPGGKLSLWARLAFPRMIIVASMQPFDCRLWYDMCGPRPLCFIWRRGSVVVFLSGTPDKTEWHKWNLVCRDLPLPELPSMRSALPERKRIPICWTAQAQPGNQIVIHRISPCLFPRTLLTQME